MALPGTVERVPQNTDESVNQRIQDETEERLRQIGSDTEMVSDRIEELGQEWDIERTLMANAATLALVGTVLGTTVNKRFLLIPGVVSDFLLQHALQGWCPPMPLFRRIGVRTAREIENERTALKTLRGDFEGKVEPKEALAAAALD